MPIIQPTNQQPSEPSPVPSPTLLPNDHLRLLVELLRLSGGKGPELARRWLAALMLAPAEDRAAIVESVERRMAELYDPGLRPAAIDPDDEMPAQLHAEAGGTVMHISTEPVQRPGYIEQVMRSYSAANEPKKSKSKSSAKDGRRSRPAS